MAVKLTVLSGSMQGHALETNRNIINVGAEPSSELPFDVGCDPEIEGQQVRFELLDDRWRLFNSSAHPIFVNQDLVRDATGLRSGDLIRLSQDGPDVLFELNQNTAVLSDSSPVGSQSHRPDPQNETSPFNKTSAEESNTRGIPEEEIQETAPLKPSKAIPSDIAQQPQSQGSPASEPLQRMASDAGRTHSQPIPATRPKSRKRRGSKLATLITIVAIPAGAIAGISIAVVLLWVVWKKDPLGIMQPPAEMEQNYPDANEPTLQNQQTKRLTEAQPDKPRFNGNRSLPGSSQQPTNLTPEPPTTNIDALSIEPFELKIVDLSTTPVLEVDLSKNVTKSSASAVRYQRAPNTQQGVEIDTMSGLLTWSIPPALQGQDVEIPFLVSPGSGNAKAKQGQLSLKIASAKPEQISTPDVLDSVYLVATETKPGNLYLPLGTACSIGQNNLLTSAVVAMGLFNAQKRGWKTVALQTPDQSARPLVIHEITDVKAHRIYLDANEKKDRESRLLQQAYFDLAILTTPSDMQSSLTLRKTSEDQIDTGSFTCIGFPINGKTTADLSKLSPLQESVKLIARIPPTNADIIDAKPPLLLQFQGDAPTNLFGGIFLDANSEAVGIYTFSADIRTEVETNNQNVLYATESLPAQSLLNDLDRNKLFWMSASEHAALQ